MIKSNKLGKRILSIVLTAALVVGLMPGNMLKVSAEGIETGKSEEIVVETVSSNDASAMTECTCETDDPAFHATNCPAYIAPENPQCFCAEKCTDDTLNIWCDVCGVQGVSACQGTDTAAIYADPPDFSDARVLTAVDGVLCIDGEALTINTDNFGDTYVIIPEGNYKLTGNIATDIYIRTEGSINLDLNGYTWDMSGKYLFLNDNVTLSLYDTSVNKTGKITTSSRVCTIRLSGSGSTFNLYSGTVENTSNEVNAYGVFSHYGSSNLYGGSIKSNSYAVIYYLSQDITINIDNTSFDCGAGYAQIRTSLTSYGEPCAVIDVSNYTGGALTVDAKINKAAVIKFFTGIQSAQDAENYKINFSCDDNNDFFEEKQEYEEDGGNKYVYVSAPSFTTQPTEENDYTVAFNHPDATLQWCEVTVLNSATYTEEIRIPEVVYEVNAGDALCVSLSECSDDFIVNFNCSYNEETLYMDLDPSNKTASVTFDSEGTVNVAISCSPFGTGEYKIEHVRYTELEGENGVQLSKTECETTYVCKATVGEREYYSDEVTIEQEHSYTCNATSDNVITKECANCRKSGTLTINAEGGIYDGKTKYGATVEKTGTLENEEVTVNYYQGDTLIGTDAPVNAGTYTAKITYEEVTASCQFTIEKANSVITAAPTPIADLVYGGTALNLINAGTATGGEMQYSLDGTNYSSAIPTGTDVGEYTVWYKVVGDKNHNDTEPASIEVLIAKGTPDIGTVSASNMENTLDVSEVVLSRSNETVPGTLSLTEGTILQYGIHDYTYVFKSGDANYNDVEGTVSITIKDTNAPTATYKVGTDGWKQFINTITFGHFCKDYTTVDITYSDEGSGVADKQYYISDVEITNTENIQWSEYTDTLNINATGKYYIYVRVTDNYGNVVIQNSEGIVVYAESVITPTSFSCEYGEENSLDVDITTNGNTFANLTDGSGNEIDTENYSIDGSTLTIKGEYLSDLDVGEYTYKICMNPQGVENTEETLTYSFVVKVTAKELTVTGATATSRDYIANDKTVDITGVTLSGKQGTDDVSVEITGLKGTLSSANAADYTEVTLPELKLSGADKDNYVLIQPSKAVPTNVTISPQATGTAQNVTKKYLFSQENADTINLVSMLPKDCGTVVSYGTPAVSGNVTYKVAPLIEEGTLAYTVADGSVGNAGTIKIDVKTQNYTSVLITISVALVDQIPVTQQTEVTLKDESQKLTYGQKLSVLELTEVVFKGTDGETVNGTLQWKNGDSIPTVDTKKASWEFVPSASYNDKYATAEGELTISVVPATPVVDTLPTVNAITYHPDTTLADIALSGGKMNGIAGELTGTWAWKDATICPKAGDNTYVAVFTPEDGTNYKTKEVDITVSVAKATPYIKTAVAADAITYGEALKNSALSGGAVQYSETDETAVAGSWSWKEVTTKPVVADSNVTQYDVVFTPTDAENYNKVETKITLTVNKAETTPNMPESTMSALYSQKTVGALELPEGWVWNEADSEEELTVDVAVEATAIYNGADKGNYVTESVTISITRQACDHEESDILYTGEGEKAPTCTVDGIGHTECTKCKEPMQTNVTVEASGHTGGKATCKNKAECSVCHEGYGELDKNNHAGETEVKDAKAATCDEEGYTGDTYCKDCGVKIVIGTKIDKSTAHTWDNGVVTKEATATEKGEKTYTCSVCKTTKKEEIPALGAPKVGEEIASEDGSATYKVTEAGENGNLVTYEAPTDKNQATVVVPATVTINNITYNVTTISDTAFAGNKKLTSVTIGDNVTGFGDKTFKGCSNLKTVNIGNGVTSIPANAFSNFKNLTTVKMGTRVKTIGKSAFYGCKALKTITIGKSVTKIGSKAFYGCSKTKTLTIKSSKLTTKKIGSKAFTKTPKSMTVKVPKKKFKAYKSMFIKRGVNKKAKFRKS